jgi:hypothetical protein
MLEDKARITEIQRIDELILMKQAEYLLTALVIALVDIFPG